MKPTPPTLGIIVLDTRFPRPCGDAGNPVSWPMPVLLETVPAASVARIVTAQPDLTALLPFFRAALRRLIQRGAGLITTSCGFLVLLQAALQRASPVPVISSSLLALPALSAALAPARQAGVITFDSRVLGAGHLLAAGADPATPVVGVERGGELYRVIRHDLPRLDPTRARADVLAAGEQLRSLVPALGAVVLECTNLPPYRDALAQRLGVPVYDIFSTVATVRAGRV